VAGWRRWLRLMAIVGAVVLVYFIVPVSREVHRETIGRGVAALLIVVLLAVGVVRQLRLHLDDTSRQVDGLIVTIVVVMAVFSLGFYNLEAHSPAQFDGLDTRLDALYFTMATAATVGFGDVHAVGQAARGLVLVQMVFDVVFIGTAVALLSSRVRAVATARAQGRTTHRNPR
jgi:voltage-gated potassium channel